MLSTGVVFSLFTTEQSLKNELPEAMKPATSLVCADALPHIVSSAAVINQRFFMAGLSHWVLGIAMTGLTRESQALASTGRMSLVASLFQLGLSSTQECSRRFDVFTKRVFCFALRRHVSGHLFRRKVKAQGVQA